MQIHKSVNFWKCDVLFLFTCGVHTVTQNVWIWYSVLFGKLVNTNNIYSIFDLIIYCFKEAFTASVYLWKNFKFYLFVQSYNPFTKVGESFSFKNLYCISKLKCIRGKIQDKQNGSTFCMIGKVILNSNTSCN